MMTESSHDMKKHGVELCISYVTFYIKEDTKRYGPMGKWMLAFVYINPHLFMHIQKLQPWVTSERLAETKEWHYYCTVFGLFPNFVHVKKIIHSKIC